MHKARNIMIAATLAIGLSRTSAAQQPPTLSLSFDSSSRASYQITGAGFDPASWIWLTVDDETDGGRWLNGPDAFQPDALGRFLQDESHSDIACAHRITARAWVNDAEVANSTVATKPCGATPDPTPSPAASSPADPNAVDAVKKVIASMHASKGPSDRRLIIGQTLRSSAHTTVEVEQPVTALTSQQLPAPKLIEMEISEFERSWGELNWPKALTDILKAHAALGGYVGLTYHMGNPYGADGDPGDTTPADFAPLLDPARITEASSEPQRKWRAMLDNLVSILKQLQENNTVVFLRPLHESNGDWFWWGNRAPNQDGASFKALWRALFQYVTVENNIHNVVWVYAGNRNDIGVDPTLRYPGNDLVDVVGLDIYNDDLRDTEGQNPGYQAMRLLGKPLAITEYGAQQAWGGASGHDGNLTLPNDKVIKTLRTKYADAVLATAWYSSCSGSAATCTNGKNWAICDKAHPEALLLDPWAITR